jgi:AAA family ATP:ADP antiporter
MKTLTLPVRRGEWRLFATMFSVVCLIHLNFWILRSVRNTLAVADRGGAAELIPFFELWGALPASILLTWILSRLLRRLSYQTVFYVVTTAFLLFFAAYALWLYPYSQTLPIVTLAGWGPHTMHDHWVPASFYVMSELWKVALLSLLFWGYANRCLPMAQAKRFYAPLLLGGSVAALIAGPLTMFCTSYSVNWQQSMQALLVVVVMSGICLMVAFTYLYRLVNTQTSTDPLEHTSSLSDSFRAVISSPYLGWLAVIVFADYLAYSMSEVVFLGVLKEYCKDPTAYCHFMGSLTFWSGLLTAISAIWIAPKLLENYRWSVPALITPLIFLGMSAIFFFIVCMRDQSWLAASWMPLAVAVGSVKHCLLRASKFTLFDTTRELGYIPLSRENQMHGKLVIDGIGCRAGRALSSVMNMGLISVGGGFIAGAPYAGSIALAFTIVWITAVRAFGDLFEQRSVAGKAEA